MRETIWRLLVGLIALQLLLTGRPGMAAEELGMEIVDTCRSERLALLGDPTGSVRYGLCLGYLKGVADSLNGDRFCIPENRDTARLTQELKEHYLSYALAHPESLKLPARATVIPAFQAAYPCEKQPAR